MIEGKPRSVRSWFLVKADFGQPRLDYLARHAHVSKIRTIHIQTCRGVACYVSAVKNPGVTANTKGRLLSRPFVEERCNYFFGAIASLVALATRNFTTVFALI
jgi:hypothetical protein